MNFNIRHRLNFALIAVIFAISGCASDRLNLGDYSQRNIFSAKGSSYKVGKPYKIRGQWYYPEENYDYKEVGMASWYGEDFHAKYTANGEIYNMNTLTAAHRTLPLPSIVKVTNLENGRSLILRVNDRGPFAKNRIIDISKKGAQLLGFQNKGITKVRVEIMEEESRELKQAILNKRETKMALDCSKNQPIKKQTFHNSNTQSGEYFVQAGAFTSKNVADNLTEKLNHFGNISTSPADIAGNRFYRVRIGPYTNETEARNILAQIENFGVSGAAIIKD
ncbi:MAG: septal ring lytic transglycosylase RlpA family protein [Alphaproteobacteria bacterium]|nr:septal ring lytic transglycosylase RlpA family protein [Alphaproteobacteria bacterium]